MSNIFKHSQRLLTNFSIKVAVPFIPKMSSNTRSLRSRALIKTEQDVSDNKGPQSSLQTSKYFRNKQIKQEQSVPANNKVVKGTKTAKAIKIKQEDQVIAKEKPNVSTKTRKMQAQKTVIKTEPDVSERVKTEALSDDDFTPKSTLTNSQKGKEQKSTKTRKMQAQKTVIKTEPTESKIVKTEVLSDYAFTHTDSKLEIQKMATEKVSPQKRKPVQKSEKVAKVKTEHVQDVEDIGWQPENWRVVLDNILQMRKLHVAPVDSLGCEECPEKGVLPEVSCI